MRFLDDHAFNLLLAEKFGELSRRLDDPVFLQIGANDGQLADREAAFDLLRARLRNRPVALGHAGDGWRARLLDCLTARHNTKYYCNGYSNWPRHLCYWSRKPAGAESDG